MKQRLILAIVALWGMVAGAKATNFISDLMVSTHSKEATAKSQLTSAGYTVIDQDMNQGGGGDYVYIGYKTSTNLADAITGLLIVSGSSYAGTENQTVTQNVATFYAAAYTSDSKGGNLNRGRGSSAADLYLYYTKYGNTTHASDSRWKPITGLAGVASTTARYKSSYSTYVRKYVNSGNYDYTQLENANLNEGGSASYYTYLNVTSTHVCSLAYAPTSTGSGTHKYYCTVCAYTRSTDNCNYGNWISVNANQCYHQCSVCSDKAYASHTFGGIYNYYNATQCFTACSKCAYKKYNNHNWGGWYSSGSGSHNHTCGYCNYTAYESHNWNYTNAGITGHDRKCSVCNYVGTKENHTIVTDAAAVAATCTTAGSTEAEHCSKCTYTVTATTIPALGHELTHTEAVAVTCTTDGNPEYWYCSRCENYYLDAACTQATTQEGVHLAALGHDLTHTEALPATCTTTGNVEYWYCSRCENYYLDAACTEPSTLEGVTLAALGHTPNHAEAVAATCTAAGNVEYWQCSRCGEYFLDEACTQTSTLEGVTLAALGHELEHFDAVEATCTEGNVEYWHCTRCDNYYLDEQCAQLTTADDVATATGHDFDDERFCLVCGKGEPAPLIDGKYEIAYPGHLYWFAEYVNAGNTRVDAVLTNDITLNTNVVLANGADNGYRVWTPIGTSSNAYGGTFDGQEHTVSGLYVTSGQLIGLFGYIAMATIQNVHIADSYLRGTYIGFICGEMSSSEIRNCHTDGKIAATGSYAGGICGRLNSGGIYSCTNSGSVSSYSGVPNYLGGICGYVTGQVTCNIFDCSNSGSIRQDKNSTRFTGIGGICGYAYMNYTYIRRCFNSGEIVQYSPNMGTSYYSKYAGGICGYFRGTMSDCYNVGTVKSNDKDQGYMGGICGIAEYQSSISNCYNVGPVTGYTYVGSICGSANSSQATVTDCYYRANSARSYYVNGSVVGGVPQNGIGTQSYSESREDVEGSTTVPTTEAFVKPVLNIILRSTNFAPVDMNGDGKISLADITLLVNILNRTPTTTNQD